MVSIIGGVMYYGSEFDYYLKFNLLNFNKLMFIFLQGLFFDLVGIVGLEKYTYKVLETLQENKIDILKTL